MPDVPDQPVLRIRYEGRELLGQDQERITIGRGYDVAVRIDHDPGRPVGLVELLVEESRAEHLVTSLESRAWSTHR